MMALKFSLHWFCPHSFPFYSTFQFQSSLTIMLCSTVSSSASNTRPFAYYTVRITCPHLESPNPWTSPWSAYYRAIF